jgi:hypothetical protein
MTEKIHAESQEVIDTHLRTSRDAWNNGKHAGITVYMLKGTTSKKMVETRSYVKKLFLWSNSLKFWVAPHIRTGWAHKKFPLSKWYRKWIQRTNLTPTLVGTGNPKFCLKWLKWKLLHAAITGCPTKNKLVCAAGG